MSNRTADTLLDPSALDALSASNALGRELCLNEASCDRYLALVGHCEHNVRE